MFKPVPISLDLGNLRFHTLRQGDTGFGDKLEPSYERNKEEYECRSMSRVSVR